MMKAEMQKRHFECAAQMVNAIQQGKWTNALPDWALSTDWTAFSPLGHVEIDTEFGGNVDANVLRAIWTAEAFIMLFQQYNARFDRERFLKACGF